MSTDRCEAALRRLLQGTRGGQQIGSPLLTVVAPSFQAPRALSEQLTFVSDSARVLALRYPRPKTLPIEDATPHRVLAITILPLGSSLAT